MDKVLNLLSHPIAPIIIGVLTIFTSILLWVFQRKTKKLSYEILSEVNLLSYEEEISERLKIFFDNEPVQNLSLIFIRILNSGHIPITSPDYETSINLMFGNENSKIISYEIVDKSPENIMINLAQDQNVVEVLPTLINQDDYFTIKLIISNYNNNIIVKGRIIGVKKINKLSKIDSEINQILDVGFMCVVFSIMFFILAKIRIIQDIDSSIVWIFIMSLLILLIGCQRIMKYGEGKFSDVTSYMLRRLRLFK